MQQFVDQVPGYQRHGPLFFGGRFMPLSQHKVTVVLHTLLQPTSYNEQHFASHSFRIRAATTAAAAGLALWLIKTLGRWNSDAYETYIQPAPAFFQAIPHLLARTDTRWQPDWNPDQHN